MSFDYTGSFSGSFFGVVTASNGLISSSAQVIANLPSGVVSSSAQVSYDGTGLISSSNQISYVQVRNKPTTISAFQKNSIVANNRFREVTYPEDSASVSTRLTDLEARTDETGSDSQTLSVSGNELTIAGGNTVTIPTGSEQTLSFNDGTNALTISDGNTVDLSALAGGGGGGSGLALTASDEGVELSKNVRTLDFVGNAVGATGAGNVITIAINTGSLPSGLVSSSDQILPIATSSITNFDTEVSRSVAEAGFGSGGDTIPDGTISSSAQVVASLPSGVVSGSSQVSYNSISDVPSGIISSSDQILPITTSSITNFDTEVSRSVAEAGFGSGGDTIPDGTISSSAQVESIIDDTYISASAAASGFGSGGDTFPFTGSAEITGSLRVDGPISASGEDNVSSTRNNIVFPTKGFGMSVDGYQHIQFVQGLGQLSLRGKRTPGAGGSDNIGGVSIQNNGGTKVFEYYDSGSILQRIRMQTGDGATDLQVEITGALGITGFPDVSASLAEALSTGGGGSGDITAVNAGLGLEGGASSGDATLTLDTSSTHFTTAVSASAATAGFGTGGGTNDFNSLTNVPSGLVSSSDQILPITTSSITDFDTEVSRSAAEAGFGAGGASIPAGTLSSSAQIASDISGAFTSTSSSIASDVADIISGVQIVASASYAISASHEIITEVSSSHAVNADTASFVDGFSVFNGDRVVSNTDLGDLFTNNFNAGTSGSLKEFIESVFFPNSAPSITTSGFTIQEFEVSGSVVGTVTATDAEGQAITFRAASSYTDDFFKIASDGQVTLNTQSTESMNTDNTPGSGSHPFPIEAVDTFSGVGSRTIYIRVNPNTAPKWREVSVAGSVITTFTSSLNEDSVAGNNKARVFFTDDESDTITINTGSLPTDFANKFSLDIESTYVQLNQTTSSLDYEDITEFNIVLTASDQHYQDGDDTEAIAYLPFQVAVVDNIGPSVNNQTLSGVNENSSNGANAGSISATDPESNTITFSNFTLQEVNLDGGADIKASLDAGAGDLYNPARDPFQVSSTGVVTRKNGMFLNSDVANNYIYEVTVTDAFNTTTDTGLITIPIADDAQSTITDNWTNPYIIESAVDGDSVRINTNGRTGTIAQWSSATSQRWEVDSENDLIEVTTLTGSSTQLRVKNDISGSLNSFDGDDRISVRLTASEHGFETTKQFIDVDVRVARNNAPDIIFTNTSANLNTNGARSGSLLTTISFSDVEGDTLDHTTFVFTDPSGQLNSVKSGNTYLIQATETLDGSTDYGFTASIQDTHRFRTNTEDHEITIAQAGIGTLTGDTTSFIVSNAVSGANLQDATGTGNGNASDLNVSYSPNYNSQVVQSFTSSNSAIAVDNNGGLSLAVDMSTTTSGSGDTITTDITFRDQYDNIGSGSVTVNVFAPSALVYAYGWNGGSAASEATAIASMGDGGADEIDIESGSVIAMLQSGSIGSTFSPSYVGGTATLHASESLDRLAFDSGFASLGYINFSGTSQRLMIVFASASNINDKPRTMYDGVPPDSTPTAQEFYLYAKDAAIPGTVGSGIYYFDTETETEGYSRWGVIFAEGKNTNNTRYYIMSDTASAP